MVGQGTRAPLTRRKHSSQSSHCATNENNYLCLVSFAIPLNDTLVGCGKIINQPCWMNEKRLSSVCQNVTAGGKFKLIHSLKFHSLKSKSSHFTKTKSSFFVRNFTFVTKENPFVVVFSRGLRERIFLWKTRKNIIPQQTSPHRRREWKTKQSFGNFNVFVD